MNNFFFYLALALAILDWVAVARQSKPLEYIAKPGVMLALLLWLAQNSALSGAMLLFALGMAFSLAGDVFLMLPREQFIAGLVSFLLGHLAYIAGFNSSLPQPNLLMLLWLVIVGIIASKLYGHISAGLLAHGQSKLKLPVLAYSMVISVMLISALNTLARPTEWEISAALVASLGAALFFASDSLLAWNKFVRPLPYGRLLVIIAYHLGQFGIALGAAMQLIR